MTGLKDRARSSLVAAFLCFPAALGAFMFPVLLFKDSPFFLTPVGMVIAASVGVWFWLYGIALGILPIMFLIAGTETTRMWFEQATVPFIRALTFRK